MVGGTHSAVGVPKEDLTQFTLAASQLSCQLVSTVPPLVCAQPATAFCRECHEKEMEPLWDDSLEVCDLEYYRPTLFLGYEGRVARKGWVGNKRFKPQNGEHIEKLTSEVTSSKDFAASSTQSQSVTSTEPQADDPRLPRPISEYRVETLSVSNGESLEQPATNQRDVVQTGRTESCDANPETQQVVTADLQAKKCPLHSGKGSSIFASLSLSARGGKEDSDGPLLTYGATPLPLVPVGPRREGEAGESPGGKRARSTDRRSQTPTRPRPGNHRAREEGPDGRFSLSHVWLWK